MEKINANYCFSTNNDLSISDLQNALSAYVSQFAEAVELKGDLPIILDTNVLLSYYGMSKTEKDKLRSFFENYKSRIYITKQVEKEFLRNRISTIKKDFFTPLSKISEDYKTMKSDVSGNLQSFKDGKKKILSQDYPEIWRKLEGVEDQILNILNDEILINEIESEVNETFQSNKNIIFVDDLLKTISQFEVISGLDQEEIEFVKNVYKELGEVYRNEKDQQRWKVAFPGSGENKSEPEGDFIIFHEILKFLKETNKSCIFLTNDVTKGDWLQIDKNPIMHYIECTYKHTNQLLLVIHAEQSLPNISFENIHKEKEVKPLSEQTTQPEVEIIRESTIFNINKEKGYGFIFAESGNLYFNYEDTETSEKFKELERDDVVEFVTGVNRFGDPVAKNVRAKVYSFEDKSQLILSGKILFVNKYRGFGFIEAQPENLYFHETFLDKETDFQNLSKEDDVDYIVGKNYNGEPIARLVRKQKNTPFSGFRIMPEMPIAI